MVLCIRCHCIDFDNIRLIGCVIIGRFDCVFFQAEDGIRDIVFPSVQTCALPICTIHKSDGRALRAVSPRSERVAPSTTS